MKNRLIVVLLALTALVLFGCAHKKAEKRVDEQLAHSPDVTTRKDMIRRSHEILMKHPALTKSERVAMQKIFYNVGLEMADIRNDIGKLKVLFFRKLFSEGDNQRELDVITERITRLNFERIRIMVDAMRKTRKVLSKSTMRKLNKELFIEYPFD